MTVGGWAEGSFTWNPESQDDALRLFDDDANEFLLNQLYLAVERALPDGTGGGLGGKVALLYGLDARFVHQNGLLDDHISPAAALSQVPRICRARPDLPGERVRSLWNEGGTSSGRSA